MTMALLTGASSAAGTAGARAPGRSSPAHFVSAGLEPLGRGAIAPGFWKVKSAFPGSQWCQSRGLLAQGQNSSIWLSDYRNAVGNSQKGVRVLQRPRVLATADGASSVDTQTAAEIDSRATLTYTDVTTDSASLGDTVYGSTPVGIGNGEEESGTGFRASTDSAVDQAGSLPDAGNGNASQSPEVDDARADVTSEINGHAGSQHDESGSLEGGSDGGNAASALGATREMDPDSPTDSQLATESSQSATVSTELTAVAVQSPEVVSEVVFSAEDLDKLTQDEAPAGSQTGEEGSAGPAGSQTGEEGSAAPAGSQTGEEGSAAPASVAGSAPASERQTDGVQRQTKPRLGRWAGEAEKGSWTKGKRTTNGSAANQGRKSWTKGMGQSAQPVAELQVAERQEKEEEVEPVSQAVRDPNIDYYEPKVGDEVMGIVMASSPFSAELDIGAVQLARLSAREATPLDQFPVKEEQALEQVFVLPETSEAPEGFAPPVALIRKVVEAVDEPKLPQLFMRQLDNERAARGSKVREQSPLVEVGSAIRVEVVGTTIRGAPLVSLKKVSQRIAWQRVQQMEIEKEPFEVDIVDWNMGGAVAYVEGLRGFMPTSYILNLEEGVPPNPADLVGTKMKVMVTETDRKSGRLILSQLAASVYYDDKKLRLGNVVDCQVVKLLPYGVMLRVVGTVKKGLMHISNVSRVHVEEVDQVFQPGEDIRALVIANEKGRIALSTRDLESSDGLILKDKAKVWEEAESMAAVFREEYAEEILAAQGEAAEASKVCPELEQCPPLANAAWLTDGPLEPEIA